MSGLKYRLTKLADADIEEILAYTDRRFGPQQFVAYQRLLEHACQLVGEDPMRPGSKTRDELGQSVRSFHLDIAARRKGAASHVLYYLPRDLEDGMRAAVILRVLWDGMEPRARVAWSLDELE